MFINNTETLGIIIGTATATTTGSLFITLLMVLIMLMAIAILFVIKLEYLSLIILPLMLTYMAYYSDYIATGLVMLIYIALIMTKHFIIK